MTDKAISGTDSRENDRLLPCPFCGGEAKFKGEHFVGEPSRYWVECRECHALMEAGDDMEKTIEAWNTRAERTCREATIDKFFRGCSGCGYMWEYMYGIGSCTRPNYCPNCGAKVVE